MTAGDVTDSMDPALAEATRRAADYLAGLCARPVAARATVDELRAALDVALPDEGVDPAEVVRARPVGSRSGSSS